MIDNKKTVDIPLPQFSLKILKKHLLKAWFTWLSYISLHFLPYLIFAEISSTCNSPRFNLSVIIFLIPLLQSSSVKISFSNTLLVSETTFHFTAKISIALCWLIETLKVCSLCLQVTPNPAGYFRGGIFPQPQECGSRLITETNQPVPRPSTTFFACSHENHFFFSASWKNWQVPNWLKTLKYRYRKGLDVVPTRKIEMSQTHKIKTFSE